VKFARLELEVTRGLVRKKFGLASALYPIVVHEIFALSCKDSTAVMLSLLVTCSVAP